MRRGVRVTATALAAVLSGCGGSPTVVEPDPSPGGSPTGGPSPTAAPSTPAPSPSASAEPSPETADAGERVRASYERAYVGNLMVDGGKHYQEWLELCRSYLDADTVAGLPAEQQQIAKKFLSMVEETAGVRAQERQVGRSLQSAGLGSADVKAFDISGVVAQQEFLMRLSQSGAQALSFLIRGTEAIDRAHGEASESVSANGTLTKTAAIKVARSSADKYESSSLRLQGLVEDLVRTEEGEVGTQSAPSFHRTTPTATALPASSAHRGPRATDTGLSTAAVLAQRRLLARSTSLASL